MKSPLRRLAAALVAMALAVTGAVAAASPTRAAPTPAGYVTVSVDANTLGAGYLYDPVIVPFYDGESYAALTDRVLGGSGNYRNTGSIESGFYLSKVKLPRPITVAVPPVIMTELGSLESGPSAAGSLLGEFDYSMWSGWMYSVDGILPDVGVSDRKPQDGEVARWQFTVYGYGADLGLPDTGWGAPALYASAEKGPLTTAVAVVNSATDKAALLANAAVTDAYTAAYAALTQLQASQATVDEVTTALNAAVAAARAGGGTTPNPSKVDVSTQLNSTLDHMVNTLTAPTFGTAGGEWTVLTLARAGYAVPEGYFDGYYQRIVSTVTDTSKYPSTPKLSSAKGTENSRLILALSALAKNATDVGGLDMTLPLSDFTFVKKQGINGPIFALIALDTRGYAMPSLARFDPSADPSNQATRASLVEFILGKELTSTAGVKGGWALSGSAPDPDVTSMALQALTPYRDQAPVAAAIDRAVNALSSLQLAGGGFSSWGSVNAESISQVIVALTGLGIDPATDARFVKKDGNAVTALLEFYVDGGGFRHIMSGKLDAMATDQAGYALVAYDRFTSGRNALYAMGDAGGEVTPTDPGSTGPAIVLAAPDEVSPKAGSEFTLAVRATGWPEGDLKLLDGLLTIPTQFTVADVTVGPRLTGGALSWHLDPTDHKLRFVYTNTALASVGLSGTAFPADLLTVKLTVADGVDATATPEADISVGGVTAKTGSADASLLFDISQALSTIRFSTAAPLGLTVHELFTGDGVDLIPESKRAVAISISGQPAGTVPAYEDTALVLSPELSTTAGMPTYVLMTTPEEPAAELTDPTHYSFAAGTAQTLRFGDTDANNVINAQDALDVISAWLRKIPVTTDNQILVRNVTSDARINTADALALMEHYVSGTELAVTTLP